MVCLFNMIQFSNFHPITTSKSEGKYKLLSFYTEPSPFTTLNKFLNKFSQIPLCVFPLILCIQTHKQKHLIPYISGICRITTMNVLMFSSDYLEDQLHNNKNELYVHSIPCMYRCVTKRYFSLNAFLHISQT
jgi:hypothetical protein